MVLYLWENRKLVELYKEKLRNTIEIVVHDHWFALKYKKHNAKLYKMMTEDAIQVEASWPLKMKTFKSQFRTMQMSQFRENLLIIIDVSYVADGTAFEIELFDTSSLASVYSERVTNEDEINLRCLAYSPKYAMLVVIEELGHVQAYQILENKTEPGKVVVKFIKRKLMSARDKMVGFINNASDSHFVGYSEKGSVYISEANHLDFEIKMKGKGFFVDLMLYKEQNNVFGYAADFSSRQYGKVSFETRFASILLDREFVEKKPFVESRQSNRRREEVQADAPALQVGNTTNQGQYEVGMTREMEAKIEHENKRIAKLNQKIEKAQRDEETEANIERLQKKNAKLGKKIRKLEDKESEIRKRHEQDIKEIKEQIWQIKVENDEKDRLNTPRAKRMKDRLEDVKTNILNLVSKGKKTDKATKQIKYLNNIKTILKDILEKA